MGTEMGQMDKKEIRDVIKDELLNITPDLRKEITNDMAAQLFASKLWKEAKVVGVTVSGGFEWDTAAIIEQGWQDGKTIAVPKCIPEFRRLEFYKLESFHQLENSFYNLQEPDPEQTSRVEKQEMDLLIVPGLAFDKRGYRVGFGGGYYDRFLTDFPNSTISIFYSKQLLDHLPNESFDIPVQALLTERGFIKKEDR